MSIDQNGNWNAHLLALVHCACVCGDAAFWSIFELHIHRVGTILVALHSHSPDLQDEPRHRHQGFYGQNYYLAKNSFAELLGHISIVLIAFQHATSFLT